MADFTLNAPGTTNNPWTPANIITPTGGLKSDSTGFRCVDSPGGTPGSFAHNANYGPIIEATFTLATAGAPADDLMGGALVRSGANAGALIGVWIESTVVAMGTLNPAGTFTSASSAVTITRALSDVWDVTVSIAGGTATVACKQNGTPITFNVSTTTTYATETSLAAGGNFSPFDNNTLYLSQFTGTGIIVVAQGPTPLGGPPRTQMHWR